MILSNNDIEVIATKNNKHYKKIMKLNDWLKFIKEKSNNGFTYKAYQIGFSQYKLEN